MISKIVIFLALVGASIAAPIVAAPDTDRMIIGQLPKGTGFAALGTNAAGAAADKDSGISGASVNGIGSVIGFAGPAFAIGAALSSPTS